MSACHNNLIEPHTAPQRPRRCGITLIETTMSVLLVAVLMVSALRLLGSSAIADQVYHTQRVSPALATQLMAEILANDYADAGGSPVFGPEAGESGSSRANFDDVDDYHGWSASPPQDRDGLAIAGLSSWTREVTVQYVTLADVSTVASSDEGLKRIIVTVTDAQGRPTTVSAIRGAGSAYEYEPQDSTTYVNWVGVTLQIGTDERSRMFTGANPLNCIPTPGGG